MYADSVSNTVKESIKNLLTKVIDIVYKLESSYFAEVDEFKVLVNYKIETRKGRKKHGFFNAVVIKLKVF